MVQAYLCTSQCLSFQSKPFIKVTQENKERLLAWVSPIISGLTYDMTIFSGNRQWKKRSVFSLSSPGATQSSPPTHPA